MATAQQAIGARTCERCGGWMWLLYDHYDPSCANCGFVKYPHGVIRPKPKRHASVAVRDASVEQDAYHDHGIWKHSLFDTPKTEKAAPVDEPAWMRQYRVLAEGLEERAAKLPYGKERETLERTAAEIRAEMERS